MNVKPDFISGLRRVLQTARLFNLSILPNRSNRLAVIILLIVLAVTIGAATMVMKGSKGTILYTVDMDTDQPQELLVTLSFQESANSFNEPLELWGLVEMDLRNVTLLDDRGQSISYKRQRLGDIERIESEGPNVQHCKYTVRVGKEFADIQQGKYSGRQLGRKTEDYVVLSGANIFLIPENLSNYRVAIIFTNVKPQWQIATTLEFNDATFQLNKALGGETTPDKLLQSVIGLGEFDLQEFSAGESHIRLYFERHCKDDPENIKSKVIEGLLSIRQNLWPVKTTYSILIIPRQERENELFIISGLLGDAIDSSGVISPYQWGRLFENLASIWTKYQPYGLRPGQEEDQWFIDGATRYTALKMLETAKISNYEDSIKETYDDYLYNARAWAGNLRKISLDPETRAVKATLVLELFDRELKSKHRSDFFAFLRGIRKNGGVFNIANSANGKTDEGASEALSAYALDPNKMVPANSLFEGVSKITPLTQENVREEVCDKFSNCGFSQRKEEKHRIIITGKTRGYLENCGCKASQNGGIARRETVIQKLRNTASTRALLIDTGDFLPNEDNSPFLNPNTERSLPLYLSLMNRLNYDGVAVGRNEIRHSVGFLKRITKNSKLKLINANIQQSGSSIAPGEVKTQIGSLTVRFIGLLEPDLPSVYRRFYEDATSDLAITDPIQTVRALSTIFHDSDTLNVVIGPISPKKIRELIDANPEIDLVISSNNDFIDPATLPDSVTEQDKEHLIRHDHSGYYKQTLVVYADQDTYGVLAVDFGLSSSGRISSARITKVPLDSSVQENQSVRRMIDNHYKMVATQSHTQDVKPLFQEDPILKNNQYVGAQSCQDCHETEYSHWITTNHSKAFLTLRRIRRELNPDCVVCHVTGYGYKPGFSMETLSVDEKKFGAVQCEICHGPGKNHIFAPATSNIRKTPEERTCHQCHTPEHSNAFDFSDRINRVRHNANTQR